MAYTMQDVVDLGRQPLNDAKNGTDDSQCRTSDAILLAYANAAIERLRLNRPDLFFGQFEAAYVKKNLADPMPIGDEYRAALADFVTARAETPDDEAVDEERAGLFFSLFAAQEGAKD